ncbi:MAG: hypothetical protein ACFFCW_45900 [Candidatus Hodarchaeota archaeon]
MAIHSIEFVDGYPLDPKSGEDLNQQIQRGLLDPRVKRRERRLSVGEHYVTPRQWRRPDADPNYDYFVEVNERGGGRFRMVPLHDGVGTRELGKSGFRRGGMTQELTPDSEMAIIAGGSKRSPTGLAVFRIIYCKED